MYIEWQKRKVEKIVLKYARDNRVVAKRMRSISSAKNFCDLEIPSNGRAHFLKGDYKGCFSVDLEKSGNGKRLICEPLGEPLEQIDVNIYRKETITGLKILKIDDYH